MPFISPLLNPSTWALEVKNDCTSSLNLAKSFDDFCNYKICVPNIDGIEKDLTEASIDKL